MVGVISYYNEVKNFFIVTIKTPSGSGYVLEKFFSHVNSVVALDADSEIAVGAPVSFNIDPRPPVPGQLPRALNITIHARPSKSSLFGAVTALSGEKEVGGAQ
jgi:hypothetical protein